jgi:signal transduction histidine kinase
MPRDRPCSPLRASAFRRRCWHAMPSGIRLVQSSGSRTGLQGRATLARHFGAAANRYSGRSPVLVAVAVDITHHEHFMASFRAPLWLFVAVAAALAGLLGWVAVRRGLAPLQAIRQGAAGVTASRLDYRLASDAVPAELAALAQTLNEMLARLEDSFKRLTDFSSDLAHELRTPISNLMTETQVALTPRPQRRRVPRRAGLQRRGIRAPGAHGRRHAVPGAGRQRPDRAQPRNRWTWRRKCANCSISSMRWPRKSRCGWR